MPGTKVYTGGFMNNLKSTKQFIFLSILIIIAFMLAGCARWPDGQPDPGETDYQLKITVQVSGELNTDDGIYYIVLDADGNPSDGPGGEITFWDDEYYYIQLDDFGFEFTQVEAGSPFMTLTSSSIGDDEFQVNIDLDDLGNPENSIDFNVLSTDKDNNPYDYLDSFLTIETTFGSTEEDYDFVGDSESEEDDFDIIEVSAEIVIL